MYVVCTHLVGLEHKSIPHPLPQNARTPRQSLIKLHARSTIRDSFAPLKRETGFIFPSLQCISDWYHECMYGCRAVPCVQAKPPSPFPNHDTVYVNRSRSLLPTHDVDTRMGTPTILRLQNTLPLSATQFHLLPFPLGTLSTASSKQAKQGPNASKGRAFLGITNHPPHLRPVALLRTS